MESDNLRRDIKPYEGLTKVYRVYNKDRTWLHKKDDSERFVGELNKELAQSKGIDVNELSDPWVYEDLTPEEAFRLEQRMIRTKGVLDF